jgi:inorganic pyrophosphatase
MNCAEGTWLAGARSINPATPTCCSRWPIPDLRAQGVQSVVGRAMANLIDLGCRDDEGNIRVVVEAPKGSTAKLKYNPLLDVFQLQRFIAATGYPYDWGFVPGTLAADGDPLDAMVIHSGRTWPGVVIPCVALGLLKLSEAKAGESETRRNDRLIAMPVASVAQDSRAEIAPQTRTLLEQFFVATGELAKKRISIDGWGSEQEATDALARAAEAYAAKRR